MQAATAAAALQQVQKVAKELDAESLGQAVSVADIRPGDHIYVWKWHWNRLPYQHHGIVMEVLSADNVPTAVAQAGGSVNVASDAGQSSDVPAAAIEVDATPEEASKAVASGVYVAHFSGVDGKGAELLTLERFLECHGAQGQLRRADYSVDRLKCTVNVGAQYWETALPPDETLHLALNALADEGHEWDDGRYHLMANNCEAFACYCKTGIRPMVSRQVARGVALGLAAIGGAAACCMVSTTGTLTAVGSTLAPMAQKRTSRVLAAAPMVVTCVTSMAIAHMEQQVLDWGVKKVKTTVLG
eukprot:TRINITY_DN26937_c0_g1_i1.p1 TRINITY_DN26937_c0_g1~~TRINITY_DN26937_c0_g1_i1.p1  ORF type:complete len:301 (+),score=99.22 TRINITY_DN26937_c0_g1_i1:191-1093(+)